MNFLEHQQSYAYTSHLCIFSTLPLKFCVAVFTGDWHQLKDLVQIWGQNSEQFSETKLIFSFHLSNMFGFDIQSSNSGFLWKTTFFLLDTKVFRLHTRCISYVVLFFYMLRILGVMHWQIAKQNGVPTEYRHNIEDWCQCCKTKNKNSYSPITQKMY